MKQGKYLSLGGGNTKSYSCLQLDTAAAGWRQVRQQLLGSTLNTQATCLVCFPLLVGGKRFSRPAKELTPGTGRIYTGICPMSHSSFTSFG